MAEKYVRIYLKRNFFLALFVAVAAFVPLFTVALIYDVVENDAAISLVPFAVVPICFLYSFFRTVRFKKMITRQEKEYATDFNDLNAVRIDDLVYQNVSWLVIAGKVAIYKEHIRNASYKVVRGNMGSSAIVTLFTADGRRYRIWCRSVSGAVKIRKWCAAQKDKNPK